MVEVFKTNVETPEHASLLEDKLILQFPSININFDLEDCDKVLRVEGRNFQPLKIMEVLHSSGYDCQILE